MQPMPHHYSVHAEAGMDGDVVLSVPELPDLATQAPPEFDGPGGHWSPETLLTGAVADCFVLSFRAVAAAGGLEWKSLACEVAGTLDRVERRTAFTEFTIHARLGIDAGADAELAERLLARAETVCLVSNSLSAPVHLQAEVVRA